MMYFKKTIAFREDTIPRSRLTDLRNRFALARGKMPHADWLSTDTLGLHPIASEEMIFYSLLLLKLSLQTHYTLFFVEKGAYPQRVAVEAAAEWLRMAPPVTYSYKIASGTNVKTRENDNLSETVKHFLNNTIDQDPAIEASEMGTIIEMWDRLPQTTRHGLQTRNPNLRRLKTKQWGKIELLCELIKAEPDNFLDDTKETTFENRDDEKTSVAWRAKNLGPVKLSRDDFGKTKDDSRKGHFQNAAFEEMSKKYTIVTKDTADDYLQDIYTYTQRYMMEHSIKFEFVTHKITQFISKSLGLDLHDVIYCDDVIASGNSYFQVLLFHKIMSDGIFGFNEFFGYIENSPLIKTCISSVIPFPEDYTEMLAYYYKGYRRIPFNLTKLTGKEQTDYDRFLKRLNETASKLGTDYKLFDEELINMLRKCNENYDLEEAKQIIMFFILDPSFLNEAILRTIGQYDLFNYVKMKMEEITEPELRKIRLEYERIKYTHEKVVQTKLHNIHQVFVLKMRVAESFFTTHRDQIIAYLDDSDYSLGDELSVESGFLRLASLFYTYLIENGIFNSGN